MKHFAGLAATVLGLAALALPAGAQNANITRPIGELERLLAAEAVIVEAQISRPRAKGDITLRADVSFGGSEPLRVKLRRAEPGAESFNNVPRFDLAAYEIQKLFLEPEDYVVPPTALQMMPRAELRRYSPEASATFAGADQVLAVVQYWLEDVKSVADVYDATRFASDAAYARHIGHLNLLTWLIEHADSNVGNFLIGRQETGARVFSIDHGVAFNSGASDRGELWKVLRVKQFPEAAIVRLRAVTPQLLEQRLGVLFQWRRVEGQYVPVVPEANLSPNHGVRRRGDAVQMGLTRTEIRRVQRQLKSLLDQVDRGRISVVAAAH